MQQTFGALNNPGRPLDMQSSTAVLDDISLPGSAPWPQTPLDPSEPRITFAPEATVRVHYLRNAAIAFAALCASISLAYRPDVLDRPVARFVNQFAHRSPTLDLAFWSLDGCFVFSGFALMAAIWYCWFGNSDADSRARILVGTLLAFPTGAISRLLQHTVPSHPRPFYDPALHFRAPFLTLEKPLNTWNSFPSDHVTVFAALLTVICLARPRLSKFLIPYFIVVESARVYMGAHYPSDLFGGAALGALVISLAQMPRVVAIGRRLLLFEVSAPAWFYMIAFFFTSRMANLFLDLRTVGSYFFHLHHR